MGSPSLAGLICVVLCTVVQGYPRDYSPHRHRAARSLVARGLTDADPTVFGRLPFYPRDGRYDHQTPTLDSEKILVPRTSTRSDSGSTIIDSVHSIRRKKWNDKLSKQERQDVGKLLWRTELVRNLLYGFMLCICLACGVVAKIRGPESLGLQPVQAIRLPGQHHSGHEGGSCPLLKVKQEQDLIRVLTDNNGKVSISLDREDSELWRSPACKKVVEERVAAILMGMASMPKAIDPPRGDQIQEEQAPVLAPPKPVADTVARDTTAKDTATKNTASQDTNTVRSGRLLNRKNLRGSRSI